jgi:epoxyqueuosine reductase
MMLLLPQRITVCLAMQRSLAVGIVRRFANKGASEAGSEAGPSKWGTRTPKKLRENVIWAEDAAVPTDFPAGPGAITGSWEDIRDELSAVAKELGLGPTRVTTSAPTSRMPEMEAWLAAGYQGDMTWLGREDRMERRRNLNNILPGVQAVIVTSLPYWPGGKTGFPTEHSNGSRARISSYAWGDDYHIEFPARIKKLAEWLHHHYGGSHAYYVDTGALMERDYGERAGLGFIGKNTLLINEKLGSGMFLGEMLTTLPLPANPQRKKAGGCGACNKCQVACPTGAFVSEYKLDSR